VKRVYRNSSLQSKGLWESIPQHHEQRKTPIQQALQGLFQPLLVHPTALRVQAQDDGMYSLPSTDDLPFPSALGKKLCLIDMDGRSFDV
jgi:hypothetical protein